MFDFGFFYFYRRQASRDEVELELSPGELFILKKLFTKNFFFYRFNKINYNWKKLCPCTPNTFSNRKRNSNLIEYD